MSDALADVLAALREYDASACPRERAALDQLDAGIRDTWARKGWELSDAIARSVILDIASQPAYTNTQRRIAVVLARHVT